MQSLTNNHSFQLLDLVVRLTLSVGCTVLGMQVDLVSDRIGISHTTCNQEEHANSVQSVFNLWLRDCKLHGGHHAASLIHLRFEGGQDHDFQQL